MPIIDQFKINTNDSIDIVIPTVSQKYNYFYKATELLDCYDQIIIEYQQGDNTIEIARNMLEVLYEEMCDVLNGVIGDQQILADQFEVGKVGYAYNICIKQEIVNDDFLLFPNALCGNKYAKAWVYMRNGIIYLEIAPLYPWLYQPKKDKTGIVFEDFMQNYKSIGFYILDKNKIKEWLEQSKKTLQKVG